jgi:hypothetical protein
VPDIRESLRVYVREMRQDTYTLQASIAVERLVASLLRLDQKNDYIPANRRWRTKAAYVEIVKYVEDELIATEDVLAPSHRIVCHDRIPITRQFASSHVRKDRRVQAPEAVRHRMHTSSQSQGGSEGLGQRVVCRVRMGGAHGEEICHAA